MTLAQLCAELSHKTAMSSYNHVRLPRGRVHLPEDPFASRNARSGSDRDPRADEAPGSICAPAPITARGPITALSTMAPSPMRALLYDRAQQSRPLLDLGAERHRTARADVRTGRDHHSGGDMARRLESASVETVAPSSIQRSPGMRPGNCERMRPASRS